MCCSAWALGMTGLVWLVFGVYSQGFYNVLDNPDLSNWKLAEADGTERICGKAEIRAMADGAIWPMTMMWSRSQGTPIFCDRTNQTTPHSYREAFTRLTGTELQS